MLMKLKQKKKTNITWDKKINNNKIICIPGKVDFTLAWIAAYIVCLYFYFFLII